MRSNLQTTVRIYATLFPGSFSLAIVARNLASYLLSAGYKVSLEYVDCDRTAFAELEPHVKPFANEEIGIHCGFPEYAIGNPVENVFKHKHSVFYFVTETPLLPPHWTERLARATAVVVPSEYNRQACKRSGLKNVVKIPYWLTDVHKPRQGGPQTRSFRLFSQFNYRAFYMDRKSPEVLFTAFKESCRGEARLVLKTRRTSWLAEKLKEFDLEADVDVIDAELGENEFADLMHSCHAVVMPSCVEGFGLVGFQALALGVPAVLALNEGHAEFMLNSAALEVKKSGELKTCLAWRNIKYKVTETDVDDLVEKLTHLMANYGIIREQTEKASLVFWRMWNEKAIAPRWGRLLEGLQNG